MSAAAQDVDLYQSLILERARAPRHGTLLACHDADAAGSNPLCGDQVRVQLRRDRSGAIVAVGFEARGCAISVASADLMADAVANRTEGEARDLFRAFETMLASGEAPDHADFGALRALAGVHAYRARRRCAALPWTTLIAALAPRTGEGGG